MSDADNIVLVTVDSLRADYCGFLEENASHTPVMDQLADDGLVFENAIAPGPATLDSMPIIFSGDFYPRKSDDWSALNDTKVVRDHIRARETIPERLKRRGYQTAAFTTNPWTSHQYGYDKGFDHFEDFIREDTSHDGLTDGLLESIASSELPMTESLSLLLDWHYQSDMFQLWDTFYDDIVEWTEKAEEPYFLWIFLVDAHMPFLPTDEFRSQSRLATYASNLWLYLDDRHLESVLSDRLQIAYGDTVEYVDDRIGQLVNDLDNSVFVIHGDHGEEFGEDGDYGHGHRLSEELIRVPLMIVNGPNGRVERPFSLADMPALLERLADGRDLKNLAQPVVQSRNFDPKTAVRGTNWKYVTDKTTEHLYCLSDDQTGVQTENPDLLELGRDVVAHWRNDETERREIVRSAQDIASNERI